MTPHSVSIASLAKKEPDMLKDTSLPVTPDSPVVPPVPGQAPVVGGLGGQATPPVGGIVQPGEPAAPAAEGAKAAVPATVAPPEGQAAPVPATPVAQPVSVTPPAAPSTAQEPEPAEQEISAGPIDLIDDSAEEEALAQNRISPAAWAKMKEMAASRGVAIDRMAMERYVERYNPIRDGVEIGRSVADDGDIAAKVEHEHGFLDALAGLSEVTGDPALDKTIERMAQVYQDKDMSAEAKADALKNLNQYALNVANADLALRKDIAAVESETSYAAELARSLDASTMMGDLRRAVAYTTKNTAIMYLSALRGIRPVFENMPGIGPSVQVAGLIHDKLFPGNPVSSRVDKALEDKIRAMSEDASAIMGTVIREGGIGAGAALEIGSQCFQTAVRLAVFQKAGIGGGSSTIVNSTKFGMFTALTTPGSITERSRAGVRTTALMATPAVSGIIPNAALSKIVDGLLNVGASSVFGYYDWWKDDGRSWKQKVADNLPSLVMDALFASTTRPGMGAVDRAALRKAALQSIPSMSKAWGADVAWRDLHRAASRMGVSPQEREALHKQLDELRDAPEAKKYAAQQDVIRKEQQRLRGNLPHPKEAPRAPDRESFGLRPDVVEALERKGQEPAGRLPDPSTLTKRQVMVQRPPDPNVTPMLEGEFRYFRGQQDRRTAADVDLGRRQDTRTEGQRADDVVRQAEADRLLDAPASMDDRIKAHMANGLTRVQATERAQAEVWEARAAANTLPEGTVLVNKAGQYIIKRTGSQWQRWDNDKHNWVNYASSAPGSKGFTHQWNGAEVTRLTENDVFILGNAAGRIPAGRPTGEPLPTEERRNRAAERVGRDTLVRNLRGNPALSGLRSDQRAALTSALADTDKPVGSITEEDVRSAMQSASASLPRWDDARVDETTDTNLRQHIARDLYLPVGGRSAYLKDMLDLGIITKAEYEQKASDPKAVGLRGIQTRADLVRLMRYAESKFDERIASPEAQARAEQATREAAAAVMDAIRAEQASDEYMARQGLVSGPGTTEPERRAISEYLRGSSAFRKGDPDGELLSRFLDGVEYGLSSDATTRAMQLRELFGQYRAFVEATQDARELSDKSLVSKPASAKRVLGVACRKAFRGLRSVADRYLQVSQMGVDTGDGRLLPAEMLRVEGSKRWRLYADDMFDKVLKDAKVSRGIANHISSNPGLDRSVKVVLGVDPRTRDVGLRDLRVQALSVISADKRGAEIMRAVDAIRTLVNTEGAIHVRWSKVHQFADIWHRYGATYERISAIPEESRTAQQTKSLEAIRDIINAHAPWRYNTDTKQGEAISVEKLVEAYNVVKTGNEAAIREYLSAQDWGTREYYYMTKRDMDPKALLRIESDPQEAEAGLIETRVKEQADLSPSGSIEHRTGISEFAEGPAIQAIRNHFANSIIQARTIAQARYVARAFVRASQEGYITKEAASMANEALLNDFGKSSLRGLALTRAVAGIRKAWWVAYVLTPPKFAWYTVRNLAFQGSPLGIVNAHYNVLDVQKATMLLATMYPLRNRSSFAAKHAREDFKTQDSQGRREFYEVAGNIAANESIQSQLRLLPKGVREAVRGGIERMQGVAAMGLGASDGWNRWYNVMVGEIIVEKYLDRFIAGDISQAKLMRALKFAALPTGHRRVLMDMFTDAINKQVDAAGNPILNKDNFYEFARRLVSTKTMLANYAYKITDRSLIEQSPEVRVALGVIPYAKGTVEGFVEGVVKPIALPFANWASKGYTSESFDGAAVWTGVGNLFTHVLSRWVSAWLVGKKIGEKARWPIKVRRPGAPRQTANTYSLIETITGYNPGGPELGIVKAINETVHAILRKEGLASALKMGEPVLAMSIVLPTLKSVFEFLGDREGMSNINALETSLTPLLERKFRIVGGFRANRDTILQAFCHALFGTSEMNRNDEIANLINYFHAAYFATPRPNRQQIDRILREGRSAIPKDTSPEPEPDQPSADERFDAIMRALGEL